MTDLPLAHHPRINEQLELYWQGLKGDKPMPFEHDVNPDALKEIWDSCFLVSARANGTFAYNYLGKSLIDAYGDDLTGREIAEHLLGPHPESLFHSFKKVAQSGVPLVDEGDFTNSKGNIIKYRTCVLPLAGTEEKKVGFLLGGMKWKAY